MRRKIWAYKQECIQCGTCCKNIVCDLGVVLLATAKIPCPALEFKDKKHWCGLITNTSKYIFPQLGLSAEGYETIRSHILKVNNLWEGCDFERWRVGSRIDMPLISKARAKKAVPAYDCSGKKLSKFEREDIVRYILLGSEIQRDITIR